MKVRNRVVFADLRVYDDYKKWLNSPKEPPFNYVGQLCERWALLLREMQFTLPNYSHIYLKIGVVQNNDCGESRYEFNRLPETLKPFDFYKEISVTLTNPPSEKETLTKFFNQLVTEALDWTGDLEQEDKVILERATAEISLQGDEIKIPLRKSENDRYIAQVLVSPRGPFSYSGTAFIRLVDKKTEAEAVRELFKYCFCVYAYEFLKRLQIMSTTIRVISRVHWYRTLPHLPKNPELSIEKIFDQTSKDVFITDMKEFHKVLVTGFLPGGDYKIEPHEVEEFHANW